MRYALLVTALLAGCASAPPPADSLVVVADRMLDVESGTYVPNVIVHIADGRIRQIERSTNGPWRSPQTPLRVGTLLPGLIDAHTHLAWSNAPGTIAAKRTVEAGFTTVRNLGSDSDNDVALRDRIERGEIVGPRMVLSGPGLGTPGGICPQTFGPAGEVTTPEQAREKVRQQVKERHSAVIKICTGGGVVAGEGDAETVELEGETLRAVIDEAHKLGVPVAAHAQGPRAIRNAIEAGVDSIEHGSLIDAELAALMRQKRIALVPTLARLAGKRPDIMEHARAAIRAGAPVVSGSDATVLPHGRNAEELQALVEAGLSPIEAIRAATTRAAALLRLKDVGAIREGFAADLVAVDGDPLQDVRALSKPTLVIARGKVVVPAL